jgi:hypothetical protein
MFDLTHHSIDFLVGQRDHGLTVRAGPLRDGHYPVVRHERLWTGDGQVVERWPVLPGDLQQVGEPVSSHQDRASNLALEHRVGRCRGAVWQQPQLCVGQGLRNSPLHPHCLVLWGGWHLHCSGPHPRRVHHHISERSPDIDPGAPHSRSLPRHGDISGFEGAENPDMSPCRGMPGRGKAARWCRVSGEYRG